MRGAGTISWSERSRSGVLERGQVPLSQVARLIQRREIEAKILMKETGADHVLYAAKLYDTFDQLCSVQFYMEPMSDEAFYKVTRRCRAAVIYALHNGRRNA